MSDGACGGRRSRMRGVVALLALGCVLGASARAEAQDDSSLEWSPRFARFGEDQYALTGAMAMALLASRAWLRPAADPGWRAELPLDREAQALLAGASERSRARAAAVSDVLSPALLVFPFAIDAVLVAGIGHGNADVAFQMGAIGVRAFLMAALATEWTKKLVARARPDSRDCLRGTEDACITRNESFVSSHTSFAFTGAGLICVQHENLALYGSAGPFGAIACATALGAASTVGALRIAAGRHYLSDVLGGAAVGLAAGYLLPKLLTYESGSSHAVRARLIVLGERDVVGLGYAGTF